MFAPATNNSAVHASDSLALFFARIGAALSGAQAANRLYRRLSRLSNSQLAARGLKREDLGRMTLQILTNFTSQ